MTFKAWLLSEIERRKMSQHEFAKHIGVNQSTISRCLSEKDPEPPGLKLLFALAKGTNTSFIELVKLAYPEVVEETSLPPDALILAQRIKDAPEDIRLAIEALIQRGT